MKTTLKTWAMLAGMFLSAPLCWGETSLKSLKVQDTTEPMAIEDAHPLFSWQMESDVVGEHQTAYRISVVNEVNGKTVWDSGRVSDGRANNIRYAGVALRPETGYTWNLTVWNAQGTELKASSRFETGLMNPGISAWNGAKWIGSTRQSLDAATNNYFEINTKLQLVKGDKASLIVGANDFRLLDAFQNPENLEGESYVRIEFDLSRVGTPDGAAIHIYRVGMAPGDRADVPFISINQKNFEKTNINDIFNQGNKFLPHEVTLHVESSTLYLVIDGKDLMSEPLDARTRFMLQMGGGFAVGRVEGMKVSFASRMQIGPWGRTHDYNTLPHLNEIGFAAHENSEVVYTDYRVLNCGQSEDRVVFDASHYGIFQKIPHVSVSGNTIRVSNDTPQLTLGYADPSYGATTMLRTVFETAQTGKIAKARLYATAMGSYELFINGKRMGEDWFTPGDSQFREVMGYHAYDVTSMIAQGTNAVAAQLSSGWYTGPMTFTGSNFNFFGDHEALLMKLVITYEDGKKQVVVTRPETWKVYRDGPIRYGSFFHGERYDANKEAQVNGWKETGYNDAAWEQAEAIAPREWIDFDLKARYDEPVRVREVLTATRLMPTHSKDRHTYIYDMGVNMVGVPEISIPAGWLRKDDVVIIRYAEQLYPGHKGDDAYYVKTYGKSGKNIAGRPLYETVRAALVTDFYIAKGSEAVTIKPTTTYRGYQYIQITLPGHQGALPTQNIKGLVLSSDRVNSGTYVATTADGRTGKLVNQLFKNIQRSQLGNFFTIPTDCPQRNERMGWTGDAQAYTRTATYNSDVQNFFRQWMVNLRADQGIGSDTEAPGGIGSTVPTYNKTDDTSFADGTTWAAAVCMVPWQLYIQYGNTQVIEENMEAMMTWLNGMDFYDFSAEYPHLSAKASGLADWLAMDNRTPSDLVNNAIYIYMMEVTATMADAIGRADYARTLRERRALAVEEWNKAYVDPATGKTRSAKGDLIHSQASYATPLNFNCFNEQNKARAEAYLAELAANPSSSGDGSKKYPAYTITTGFSGTPNILPALSRAGRSEEAFRMFTCTDFTSWLYPVISGATSIWERWNGYEVAFGPNNQNNMNSFNHFALGAVGQWMYEYQLGITSDHLNGKAGYKHFILQPCAGANYTALSGSYQSNYGEIKSSYQADGKGHLTGYQTTIPANTSATLYLPVGDDVQDFGQAEGATFARQTTHLNKKVAQYEILSGSYSFTISEDKVRISSGK